MNNTQKESIVDQWNVKTNISDTNLFIEFIETKLGSMVAIADYKSLYLLDFLEGRYIKRNTEKLLKETQSKLIIGKTALHDALASELKSYFAGALKEFTIPVKLYGTPFQKQVWHALQKIPYGVPCSYSAIAKSLNKPKAFRAVAQANSRNKIILIIPCHRVINANGNLGGYAGGISNKKWLLDYEKAQYKDKER